MWSVSETRNQVGHGVADNTGKRSGEFPRGQKMVADA